jgi:hypothetical protein
MNQIRIETNRPTNPLELGGLANQIVNRQLEIIAQQAIQTTRPDRYAKHIFDGDDTARGCGICGRRADDLEIHDERHATDIVTQESNIDSAGK